MSLKYLFGPVSAAFAEQNLKQQRDAGLCLAFNADGDTDLTIRPRDTWEDIRHRLPTGWEPDGLVLYLPYTTIPAALWSVPLPRIGLAPDWTLLWHYYRRCLRSCDLILTDTRGTEVAVREGILHARATNLCGCDRAFLEAPLPDGTRDIDILFVGNLNPAVQRGRMPWLERVARLGQRWRVLMQTGVFGDTYRRLLARAKIVFQFSTRGKCGRRTFEAAASGALILQEADNQELPKYFRDRQECVYYRADNLERLLEYYLEHSEQRRPIVEAARARVLQHGFEQLWDNTIQQLETEWPSLRLRAGFAGPMDDAEHLQTRCWQLQASGRADDLTLLRDLEKASRAAPESALLHNNLGCVLANPAQGNNTIAAEMAVRCFRRALACQPGFVLAGLNLTEALEIAGQRPAAIEAARQTLDRVSRDRDGDPSATDGLPLVAGFDVFRVEWERAGWENAGRSDAEARAKRDLVRWRLHTLLARWTGELTHHYEAALLRPDLPTSRVALGDALMRAERPADARLHFQHALDANPLDREAARLYFQCLGATGERDGQLRLIEERRLLARAVPQVVPTEPWFAEPKPRGNELVSILILCCNQLEYTRQCLESLLATTRPPYELILVDNGSTDETPAYLDAISRRPGPARVEVIRNATNLGFAPGCNQALARASGQYVVFLNNDTVLTPGWLDGLVKVRWQDWPAVGLVGPVSNGAPPPQGIPVPYTDLADLDAFAVRRRREFAGQTLPVKRVTGFCLLARRDVLERIGGLDERYGVGFFEDDDLCVRAREAGFRLLVAQEVYIHHYGSRTFQGLGIDTRERLIENFEVFRNKWGEEHAAGYALPPRAVPATPPDEASSPTGDDVAPVEVPAEVAHAPAITTRRSLCMIVKNEEHNLPECLRTVEGLFDQIVVADTGSVDGTRDVARRFGAQVVEAPWQDSFAAARNASLRHATGKWILWLDADDRVEPEQRRRLEEVLDGLGDELDAYAMQVRSVLDAGRKSFRLLDQVRLFRNRPDIRWDYRVHEQILPAVNRVGGGVRWVNVIVDHVGYQDPSLRRGKLQRNLRLLEMDEADRPDDSFTLFNLGWTLLDLGRTAEALPRLERALEHVAEHSSILRKLYHLLVLAQRQQRDPEQALRTCREGLKRFPDEGELLLEEGLLLRERSDWLGAEESWLRLLHSRKGNYFASEEIGLRGHKTRQMLSEMYLQQDRLLEAEVQWRAALTERADFEPAWMGLAEVLLRKARWNDLEELLQTLEGQGADTAKVGWLRARGQSQRREFAPRKTLAAVIATDSRAIGPRVLLSHILLQEGRDPQAAETALRAVLELDPTNKEADHNLQLLLRNSARPSAATAAAVRRSRDA